MSTTDTFFHVLSPTLTYRGASKASGFPFNPVKCEELRACVMLSAEPFTLTVISNVLEFSLELDPPVAVFWHENMLNWKLQQALMLHFHMKLRRSGRTDRRVCVSSWRIPPTWPRSSHPARRRPIVLVMGDRDVCIPGAVDMLMI